MTAEIISDSLSVVVGNGKLASFWKDLKVAGVLLAEAFPRIHRSQGCKFGRWIADEWHWKVETRRPVLGWEEEVWLNFSIEVEKCKSTCLNWWDISACMPYKLNDWMEEWLNLCCEVKSSRAWMIVFHAICRSIWEFRNNVVFNQDALKFKVDGSSRGNPALAGIGGILLNHVYATLCMFSSFLEAGISSSFAEISAILEACELCEKVSHTAVKCIIIESDSKSAVSWVNGDAGFGNVRSMNMILDIREILSRNESKILVQFVPRSGNVSANLLAKLGFLCGLNQEVWSC
ncbi:hypothetical protein Dsin_013077 [Dipteronia sinensis]|uniref:RNase H type-1 domain-containing protein n=1 Tax=Dipteronia sinensis TaxID=43782 RepID=A0AAE0AJC5_9ROSI|nr:hypothetical protein Dsin_013077 [Dipteronia sinensis]